MDVAVRAIIAFLFVFMLTRLIGRRELSSLQPFDLILLIVIGDLTQQGVTQNDMSITGLILAIGIFGVLTLAASYLGFRFPRVRPILEPEPLILIEDGHVIEDGDHAQLVSAGGRYAELFDAQAAAFRAGIR
jgi:uncharacterized membrane protein YcaP (DUF421 family)